MPVFWFGLSFVDDINLKRSLLVFVILHFLVYPSSNGYNSYMDRDEGSIGGIEKPLQPTIQLFYASVLMDILAIGLSFFVSTLFAAIIVIYILFSRLYSFRPVRLKQYPIGGYITVVVCQGSLIFFAIFHGCSETFATNISWLVLLAPTFLIGGFYPITQIYQHETDKRDGVTTISMLLGKRGTFLFCGIMYMIAISLLWLFFSNHHTMKPFMILLAFFLPVVLYFTNWFRLVLTNEAAADYQHTMRLNWLAGTCTSLAFITIILLNHFG